MVFLRLACTCEETCQCVWPPNASLYASSACAHLQLLAGPFDQGFSITHHKLMGLHHQDLYHFVLFHKFIEEINSYCIEISKVYTLLLITPVDG